MTRAWGFIVDRYLLVPIAAVLALIWANTYAESYFRLADALAFPVNEIGMALGLAYLAQEIVEAALPGGSLYPFNRAVVPLIGGLGGMIGASLVYAGYLALGDEQILARGWPVAGAADLVITLTVARAIFGRGAAATMALVFALTSDVIGLIAISGQHLVARAHAAAVLLIVAGIALAAVFRHRRVVSSWPYIACAGTLSWLGCYWSGLQPVLALLPIVPFLRHTPRDLTQPHDQSSRHRGATHFESVFQAPVLVIVFLFGLLNAGMAVRGADSGAWAVLVASLVGRPVGTLVAIGIATLAGLHLPRGTGWRDALVSALAAAPTLVFGVLFAVAVFPVGPLLEQTKLGAIATAIGLVPAFVAARLLRVGRFATVTHR